MSEVRGSGRESQDATAQEWPRGTTQVRGHGWQPGGATLHPRSVAAGRRHPVSEIRGSQEKPPHAQGRGGSREEQPQEQGLRGHRRA